MYKNFSNISTIVLRNFHFVQVMKPLLRKNSLNVEENYCT